MKHINKKLAALGLSLGAFIYLSGGKSDDAIRARVVRLVSDHSMCSGEQIQAPSGENYVLTAAHCKAIAQDGSMKVITEDGKTLQRKIIAEDPESDLLLLEGLPGVKGLKIAGYSYFRQYVRTFTHGSNMDTYETEGRLVQKRHIEVPLSMLDTPEAEEACKSMPKNKVQEFDLVLWKIKVCMLSIDEIASTAGTMPGSSGGAVVDASGDVVGVVSAGGDGFSWFVSLADIKQFTNSY